MWTSRKEVDEQVHKILGKLPPGHLRDVKGMAVARMYYKIQEYPKAIEYLNSYLKVKDEANAHKLIAACYTMRKQPDPKLALEHYQRCIQLNPKQPEVINDACQLLLDENSNSKGLFSVECAKFWLDMAGGIQLNESELMFQLRMKIKLHESTNGGDGGVGSSDGALRDITAANSEMNALEEIMHRELQARPQDVQVRVRLMRCYLEKKKLEEAFTYAFRVELDEKSGTSQCTDWYDIIWTTLTKLEQGKDLKKWGPRFWQLALLTLDRLAQLSLESGKSMLDCSSHLFRLDQYLHRFSMEKSSSADQLQPELQQSCIDHYSGQLLLHAVALVFKRELVSNHNKWVKSLKSALPLLLLGYQTKPLPENSTQPWVKHCDEDQKKLLQLWRLQGAFRCAQLGRTLFGCLEPANAHDMDQKENIQTGGQNNQPMIGLFENSDKLLACARLQWQDKNWRRQLFPVLFSHPEHKLKENSSHLVRNPKLEEPLYEWPAEADIESYERQALLLQPQSLAQHVYLALGASEALGSAPRVAFYEGLRRDVKQDLSFCGQESLSQLDIDVFLYATVIHTHSRLASQRETYDSCNLGNFSASARPHMLPYANVLSQLATPEQSGWWDLVLRSHKNQVSDCSRGEQRAQIQMGLEAVRGVNGAKADTIILFKLGAILCSRQDRDVLERRIDTLYKQGFNMMRREQQQGGGGHEHYPRFFKIVSASSTEAFQERLRLAEEAVSYFSSKMFKAHQYQQFIDEVRGLNLPMATYLQAEAYRMLEYSSQINRDAKARYWERRRDCLQQTQQLLRSQVKHPLYGMIRSEVGRCEEDRCETNYDVYASPDNHNNSSSYEDAEDADFYAGASLTLNRSRRHGEPPAASRDTPVRGTPATPATAATPLASNAKFNQLEETVNQMSKSLCQLKDDVSTGITDMRQEIKNLTEKFTGIEDLIKKLKITHRETPTRDVDPATALGLDELLIIEELDAQQHQQSQAAAAAAVAQQQQHQQLLSTNYGAPTANPGGFFNGVPGIQSPQDRFLQGAYGSPLFNQNQLYNYYAAQAQQYMRTPPAAGTLPPLNIFGAQNPNFAGIPGIFPPAPAVAPPRSYLEPAGGFGQTPASLIQPPQSAVPAAAAPAQQPPGPAPAIAPLLPVEPPKPPTAAVGGPGFFNSSAPVFMPSPIQVPQAKPPLVAAAPVVAPPPTAAVAPTPAIPSLFNRALNNQPVEKEPPANVVITSSDPLPKPATVAGVQPTLSVTIPAQHIKPSLVQNTEQQQPQSQPQQQPAALPVTVPTAAVTATSSGAFNFSFGTSNAESPFSFKTQVAKAAAEKQKEQEAEQAQALLLNESAKSVASEPNKSAGAADASLELDYDPRPDFQPIIALPDEIEVRTGEEDEEVKFCFRAKLFRLVSHEWKERGIGNIKILKNQATGVSRILMRREQTHKVCANHKINSEMSLATPQGDTEQKSFIWAANDFADEELVPETFLVRFKSPDTAKQFHIAYTVARQEAAKAATTTTDAAAAAVPEVPKAPAAAPAPATAVPKSFVTSTPATSFGKPFEPSNMKLSESLAALAAPAFATNPTSSTTVAKSLFGGQQPAAAAATPPTSTAVSSTPTAAAAPPTVPPFASFSFGQQGAGPTASPFGNLSFGSMSFGSVSAVNSNTSGNNNTLFTTAVLQDSTLQGQQQQQQSKATGKEETESDAVEEYEPTAQFNPVIPLPELVKVVTGEEDEDVLFENRAKLLRYFKETSEWKERGLGTMKLLRNRKDPSQVRLVMRREKVHKTCCNQRLLPETTFKYLVNSTTALTWAAQDFADQELEQTTLCVRFKKPETCKEFFDAVLKAQKEMEELESSSTKAEGKPVAAKEEKSGAAATASKGFGDAFKPKAGSWSCEACYTSNGQDQLYCLSCEGPKDATVPPKQPAGLDLSNALNLSTSSASKFSFGFAPATTEAAPATAATTLPSGFIFGAKPQSTEKPAAPVAATSSAPAALPDKASGFGDAFKPKAGSWSCGSCYLSNTGDALYCSACEAPKDDTVPKKESNALGSTSGLILPATTKFNFGFGAAAAPPTVAGEGKDGEATKSVFGSASFSFVPKTSAAAPVSLESGTFSFTMPKPAQQQPKSPGGSGNDNGENNDSDPEEENQTHFAPVIPLPDKVDVKTGEEDEEVLYVQRAKLYRLTDEWRERGVGNVKILRHKQTGKLRVLMRREPIFKVCLNHALTASVAYKPKDERSWLFVVHDYSEGESVNERFTLRFKNKDIADNFLKVVKSALDGTAPAIVEEPNTSAAPPAADITEASRGRPPLFSQENKSLAEEHDLSVGSGCTGCVGCDPEKFDWANHQTSTAPIADDVYPPLPMHLPALKLPPAADPLAQSQQQQPAAAQLGGGSSIFRASSLASANSGGFSGFGQAVSANSTAALASTPASKPEENKPSNAFVFGSTAADKPTFGQSLFGGGKPQQQQQQQSIFSSSQGNVLGSIFGSGIAESKDQSAKSIFGGVGGGGTPELTKSIFGGVAKVDPVPAAAPKTIFGGTNTSVFGGGSSGFVFASEVPAFGQNTQGITFGDLGKPPTPPKDKETGESNEQKKDNNIPKSVFSLAFGDTKETSSPAAGGGGGGAVGSSSLADLASKAGGDDFASLSAKNQGTPMGFNKSASGGGFYNLTHQNDFKNFQSPKGNNTTGGDGDADGEGDGDATNDDNYDPYYAPIVDLPDEIVVKTGEEDETKLFGERSRLYRFDTNTKEWKERGTGELKILEHPQLQSFRMLMRQELVPKVLLNMKIAGDLKLVPMNGQKKSFSWYGLNYAADAEGKTSMEGVVEQLACRFGKQDVADQFLDRVNQCIKRASEASAQAQDNSETED
ncbi:E3 SUMO-protein ligase RanBP2 [Drosophila subobscura]|uniref:E3 SUMO-protein ligase RanBP2 n=1 Tax=Drosophila subobscura TaxID=7241 RepID=UPI00155AE616|nr:E3 SUMO-protein ligase RanBP2 [Drosophila subobscura]